LGHPLTVLLTSSQKYPYALLFRQPAIWQTALLQWQNNVIFNSFRQLQLRTTLSAKKIKTC
jgi:hypothetical protein